MMLPSEAALADIIPLALEKYGVGDTQMGWIVADYWVNNLELHYLSFIYLFISHSLLPNLSKFHYLIH